MLAYAASRPVMIDRRPHPNAMLLIIGAHVALVAVVMSAKMDLPHRIFDPPIKIFRVPQPKTPPPVGAKSVSTPTPNDNSIDRTDTKVKMRSLADNGTDFGPRIGSGPLGGGGTLVIPELPRFDFPPFKTGPQLLTPPSELKPPYPASKLDNGEEATLTVKLTIDAGGRVIAVDPVGRADPAFLDAARRHLIAHWRYRPASEDGHAVMSSTVVTLHFELNG